MNKFGSFSLLSGDGNFSDYGACWYRHHGGTQYYVIRLENWIDLVGEREAADIGSKYCVSLLLVDISDDHIGSALQSCGYEIDASGSIITSHDGSEVTDASHAHLVKLDACVGYGAFHRIDESNGNNYLKMMRTARGLAR